MSGHVSSWQETSENNSSLFACHCTEHHSIFVEIKIANTKPKGKYEKHNMFGALAGWPACCGTGPLSVHRLQVS
jgi:hypothetical protein